MQFTPDDLRARIDEGEGKNLEFKRGLPRDEKTARTLCAFANTRGGLLLIGVGDRGEILGAPHPRETVEKLRAIASVQLSPALAVQVGRAVIDERTVVWCSVPLSPARPHRVLHEGGEAEIVVRAGSSNRVASGAALAQIRAQRSASKTPDPLQRSILAWVESQNRGARDPGGRATVQGFARQRNIGLQRARRAFTELELAGRLVGHGAGGKRIFSLP
ncbi:MAG: ATP-binding protein [Planctomycetes bacterium]|nr:ATP-binding protein [Planctomycetota bacterium]